MRNTCGEAPLIRSRRGLPLGSRPDSIPKTKEPDKERAPIRIGARVCFSGDVASPPRDPARSILVARTEQRADQRDVADARVMLAPHRRLVLIDLDRPAFDDSAVRHAIAHARLARAGAGRAAPLLDGDALLGLLVLAVALHLPAR